MNIIQGVLEKAQQQLKEVSDTPQLDAEVLLAHVLDVTRAYLFSYPEQVVNHEQNKSFEDLIQRRQKGEPVAYLTGYKEFWSLDLLVTKDTLIPRPETETLVQLTLDLLPEETSLNVADLGVGCGAIAIALAKTKPHWHIYGTDQSAKALAVAEKNVARFDTHNISLIRGDWCEGLPKIGFHALVCNPPYIAENDPHLAHLQFEPREALVSGVDGLDAISKIIIQAPLYLTKGGLLLLEHGYNQRDAVIALLKKAGFSHIKDYQDLAKNPRVVVGRWDNPND